MENLMVKEIRREVIKKLKKIKKGFAKDLIYYIQKPRRKRVEVNLYKIDKYANDNDIIIVPGKVLGIGEIKKNISLFAFAYSKKAFEKLQKMKNVKLLSVDDLANVKGVKIIA